MGQEFPLISIIVPVYNVEDYVERCLNSIVRQTYQNIEVLIVDDGSTDSSGERCEQLAEKDTRVKVFHTENRGLVAARKLGLKHALGQYIGFVDGDDYIDICMYEKLLEQLIEDDSDYIHSVYIEETENQSFVRKNTLLKNVSFSNDKEKINFLEKYVLNDLNREKISPSIWSKLFKSEFIKRCYEFVPNEQQYGEDVICLMISILEASRISFTNEAYYHYIVRSGSMSHEDCQKHLFNEVHLLHNLLKCILEYKQMQLLEGMMYEFIRHRLMHLIEENTLEKSVIHRFFWGNIELLMGKKIILFGAGRVGRDYYAQICKYKQCEIVLWVDSNAQEIECEYTEVHMIKDIENYVFDYVLIAVNDQNTAQKIGNQLIEMGINANKMIWAPPIKY